LVAVAAPVIDRRANERHSRGKVARDDPSRDAQHAIPKPFEVPVTTRTRGAPTRVSTAVDFTCHSMSLDVTFHSSGQPLARNVAHRSSAKSSKEAEPYFSMFPV
jgi:hypothetical protein